MDFYATIQARSSSTRLPRKVLKKIGGLTVLEILVKRIKKSQKIKDVIVATTKNKSDDAIVKLCKRKKIRYFRGSENDVLGRISDCLKKYKIKYHLELFGDSPLLDPQLLDEFITVFKTQKLDYLTNSFKTTYPPGMEINLYNSKVLFHLEKNIKKDSKSREHVIGNFKEYINKKFKIKNIIAPKQFNYPNIYFEIDTLKDLTFFKKMYENNNKFFDLNLTNLISMVKKYKLNKINSKVYRRWKRYRDD